MWHTEREIQKLRKANQLGSQGPEPSAVMQRFLAKRRQEEHQRLTELRNASRKKNLLVKAAARKAKAQKLEIDVAKARAKDGREALARMQKTFSIGDLGQGNAKGGTAKHHSSRVQLLERLRLRAPPLSPALEALWHDFARRYSLALASRCGAAVGVSLSENVAAVMKQLGHHLLTVDGKSQPPSGSSPGDRGAFETFVRRGWRNLPRDASTISV